MKTFTDETPSFIRVEFVVHWEGVTSTAKVAHVEFIKSGWGSVSESWW